jgi:hypothetical protein
MFFGHKFSRNKPGGANGSTCGKKGTANSLYIVVIKATNNLYTAYAVVTLHGGIGRLPVWKVGNPLQLVMYIVSRESIFRLPGNHSVNQSRVEYTSLELRQIALEQIRILPAQLEVSDRPPILTAQGSPSSANTLLSIFGQTFHYHGNPGV